MWQHGEGTQRRVVMGYLAPVAQAAALHGSGGSVRSACHIHSAPLGPGKLWGWGAPQLVEVAEVGGPNRVEVLCRDSGSVQQA